MNQPRDYSARRRFAEELDRNFSVIASAGSGKTQAITERIVQLARSSLAAEILPKLVVVTFTHRAADEMQQRTRQRILEEHRSPEIQIAFNRAFFGTIHSFCMKLLTSHGHYLGLPSSLDLIAEDDEEIWEAFVQEHHQIGRNLSQETREALFRLAPVRQLMELGRNARTILSAAGELGPCPSVDFGKVQAAPSSTASKETIANSKAELADWKKRYDDAGWEFVRWPIRTSNAREFSKLWIEAFTPLRSWVANAAKCVAAEVQRDFRDFRVSRGLVTYADQVALADELLQHPIAGRRVREENFRVILDEAQDTDPTQFSVLTEITRPPEATGRWLTTNTFPPRPGHFCMVGDFQQSIYRDRADLNNYRAIHRALLSQEDSAAVEFSVTFRLDQKQLKFVNDIFRALLNDENGQVKFVELQPRPNVLPGQVIGLSLGAELLPKEGKSKDYQKARIEAGILADWIKNAGLQKLRADSWREVAILCPRKLWLRTMATSLRRVGLPVTVQSESDLNGDNPAYAWLTALCAIMVDPRNSYEIVGVLREVFGVADHDLVLFSEGVGSRFRVDHRINAAGVVSSPLRLLADIRSEIEGLSLFAAVQLLVEQTDLRKKLQSLPNEDFTNLGDELDGLLALAAMAETRGLTLTEFTEKLRLDFLLQRDVRRSTDDGIQLITAQKAKGSEWQAVILPFLGRGVIPPSPRYPGIIKIPGTSDSLVALTKDDFPDEVRSATKTAVQQEMARLLYVATTRARHTLVLALDEGLFARPNGELQTTGQLKCLLGENQINRAHFETLASEATPCSKTSGTRIEAGDDGDTLSEQLPRLGRNDVKRVQLRSRTFVRKFNPSSYDPELVGAADQTMEEQSSVVLTRSVLDTPATLYGRWWHTLMQRLIWFDRSSWPELFEAHQRVSPVPKRSADEWQFFLNFVNNDPNFAARLNATRSVLHTEMPFCWLAGVSKSLEGIIDFAVFDSKAKHAFILDWKTNRIDSNGQDDLAKRYLSQMAAYWQAIAQLTGGTVDAGIYSTAIGQLIIYRSDELTDEWARLVRLSQDEFEREMRLPANLFQ
ncbi:MAG TPA: UvrD-helicase domain-containing protein [Chthoniobacterales bacterium]|nr:UvrD-helicase domain-containing protein [Chthoniobacterales bacterium]